MPGALCHLPDLHRQATHAVQSHRVWRAARLYPLWSQESNEQFLPCVTVLISHVHPCRWAIIYIAQMNPLVRPILAAG